MVASTSACILSSPALPRAFATSAPSRLASVAGSKSSGSSLGPWAEPLSAPRLNRYLVVAEDYPDASANARRLEVRERHLEHAQKGKQAGRIELGGALLKRDFHELDEELGPGVYMGGSVLVVLGESIADVRARVMEDEYVKAQVWDASRLKIFPFLQAPLRTPAPEASEAVAEQDQPENRNVSLGQLRQDMASGKGHTMVTLGALRKMHKRAGPVTN
ncbi:uncharacterized protein PFL1_00179 [Pseudozyma flocculosa PF-1]|nr:uncharacterized protein PFL1_00179 [Pseudozyma flocculosa PF-1]EPQ31981.1 hypothetical protein PFL1_00179 [Pseudozyma flocculosa PF-1]